MAGRVFLALLKLIELALQELSACCQLTLPSELYFEIQSTVWLDERDNRRFWQTEQFLRPALPRFDCNELFGVNSDPLDVAIVVDHFGAKFELEQLDGARRLFFTAAWIWRFPILNSCLFGNQRS